MTKNEIIQDLNDKHIVQNIILNISHGRESKENLRDLEQDVYMILLSKPEKFIQKLHENCEMNFWLANIIYTQLRSSTSPYYRNYKKFNDMSKDLDTVKFLTYEQDKF